MTHMATELSALSTMLPTMVPSSSKLYPIAISEYDRCTPAAIIIPSADSMKRKLSNSMRGSSPPTKKEKAVENEVEHYQDTTPQHMRVENNVEVVRHSCSSTSATHQDLIDFKPDIEEADRIHNEVIAEQPHNPILPETGKPRFTFSAYQIKLPTEALIEELKYEPTKLGNLAESACFWSEFCIRGRLKRNMCLRSWEWAVGEPEKLSSDHIVNVSAKYIKGRKRRNRSVVDAGENDLTFAERVEKFTYMRKDDPMMKGRKIKIGKGNKLISVSGDFADEVDNEDFAYDTDFEDTATAEYYKGKVVDAQVVGAPVVAAQMVDAQVVDAQVDDGSGQQGQKVSDKPKRNRKKHRLLIRRNTI